MITLGNLMGFAIPTQTFSDMQETPVPEYSRRSEYIIELVSCGFNSPIGQAFAEKEVMSNWGITPEDQAILLDGPENPYYKNVWEKVKTEAFTDLGGCEWYLLETMNALYMVRNDIPDDLLDQIMFE